MITENRENGLIHLFSGEISFLVRTFEKKLPEVIYWGKPINIDGMGKGSSFNLDFLNPPMPIAVLDQPISNSILPTRSYAYRGHQGIRGSRSGLDFAAKFEFSNSKINSEENSISSIARQRYFTRRARCCTSSKFCHSPSSTRTY